jgi:predicted MPP superfamily phosphohydrolase
MPLTRFLVFLLVVGGFAGLVHAYLWLRLVRNPAWPEPWRGVAAWTIAALGLSIIVALAFSRALPRAVATPLVATSHVWLGAMFYLFVLALAAEPVVLVAGRTTATSRVAAVCVAAAAVLVCAAGAVAAARGPGIVRITVPLTRLDSRLTGFRIVQVSDVHVQFAGDRAFVERIVASVNELDADVVAITGDLVDGTVDHLAGAVEPLRGLRARHGVFLVTGNHEFYSGADAWCAHLASLGIRVLRNERCTVGKDGAAIDIAGVDDPTAAAFGRAPDMAAALDGRDASRPVVLLAHQPSAVYEAQERGVDLQLSGHTHGGQLQPFGWLVRLFQPSVAGLSRFGGTALYVSRGTGLWGPPMRVLAPAEITVIELTRE